MKVKVIKYVKIISNKKSYAKYIINILHNISVAENHTKNLHPPPIINTVIDLLLGATNDMKHILMINMT